MEAFNSLPEDVFAEVIYDKLYVTPPPIPYHQEISFKLVYGLACHVVAENLGQIYFAPTGIYIPERRSVVLPDIIFFKTGNPLTIDKRGIHGSPDLLVEIFSPSTRKRDRTLKKELYEDIGVKEYWMIDPETNGAEGYFLSNGKYSDAVQLNSCIHVRILNKTIAF
jgi:Uma2 family endonuclease